MAKIIIEELNRFGHVLHRHRFDAFPINVGRGYHNDLIVDDPYVSPQHLTIHEQAGGWSYQDNNSENGTKVKTHSVPVKANHLNSGDDIVIGRSRLRLLSPSHSVADTHLLPSKIHLSRILARPSVSLSVLLLTIALLMVDAHLVSDRAVGVEKLFAKALPTLLGALVWGGIWTFVGRVITHRANFLPHFIAGVIFMLISLLVTWSSEYLGYLLHNEIATTLFEFVIIGLAFAGLIYINLTNSTHIKTRTRMTISHSVAWSSLMLGLFLNYVDTPDFSSTPEYVATLKPPFAKIVASQSLDDFLQDSAEVFTLLEHDTDN